MTDFTSKRNSIHQRLKVHKSIQADSHREYKETADMLDKAVNPLIRKYGIKAAFDHDMTIFLGDQVYMEMQLEPKTPMLRKDILNIARYIWELLSGYEYQKGGLYNIKYWEGVVPEDKRIEFHYHPDRFPAHRSHMKLKLPL